VKRILLFGVVLALATAGGLLYAAVVMGAPPADLQQLTLIMLTSGAASLLVGGFATGWFGGRRYGLRLRLAVVYVAGMAVTLINVLAASLAMFLSTHDLLLLLLALGFSTVLSLLYGIAVTGAVVSDVHRLTATASQLAQGDLAARAHLSGDDEVAQLASTFDQMAEQLQTGIERERAQESARREMVAAVSHDLRTPLTTIRAMVEALSDGVVAQPDEVRRYLALTRAEVQHLSRLIDDLFELSQIESGALRLDLAPTNVAELIGQTVDAYAAAAHDAGVTLDCDAGPNMPSVPADGARLTRVLRNLLDNALRYTPSGGRILVTARLSSDSTPASVNVTVQDTGPGLPDGDAERVFDRFYRSASARTRTAPTTGAGLGLTIARGLVQAHGGRMWAENVPSAGAAFHFTLPLAAAT
jgi:signal transduction histidine kinase